MIKSSDLNFYSYSTIRKIEHLKIDAHTFFDADIQHKMSLCQKVSELTINQNVSLFYINISEFQKLKRLNVLFDRSIIGKFRVNFYLGVNNKNNMTHVTLHCYHLSTKDLDDISNYKNLKHLELVDCSFPENSLEMLRGLKNIETLIINNCNISNVFFIAENYVKLENLNLSNNKISVMPRLERLKNLRSLSLVNNQLDNMLFAGSLGYIELLDLSKNKIDQIWVSKNGNKKNHILKLVLSDNPIMETNVQYLKNFTCDDLVMDLNSLTFREYLILCEDKKKIFASFFVYYKMKDGFVGHEKSWFYQAMSSKIEKNVYKIRDKITNKEDFLEDLIKLML